MQALQSLVDDARRRVDRARRIVVLTGAGISTESGIPDFRGPRGVWTKNPAAEKQSTIQHYLADAEVRKAAWRARLDSPAWSAEPNAGHRALVALERRGKLHALVTQNIDELHQRAGQSPALVVEVHGSMRRVMCWQCGRRAPMEEALARVRAGEDDPHCLDCGGILKSDTISFGQALVPGSDRPRDGGGRRGRPAARRRHDAAGAAGREHGADRGARRAQKSSSSTTRTTAMDELADVVIRAPIGAVLTAICAGAASAQDSRR